MESKSLFGQFFGMWNNEFVRYISEDGEKACSECKKNNGKIFHLDDKALPWLPLHPHCRCQYSQASDPLKIITSEVEKYRIKKRLKEKYHMMESVAEIFANKIIEAREKNPKIKDQQRFILFDGKFLFSSDGELFVEAVSGKPVSTEYISEEITPDGTALITTVRTFDYSHERQGIRNTGGIPQGVYYIKSEEKRFPQKSPISHVLGAYSWGTCSWSLHPDTTTDTRNRSGFFIHGGKEAGSAGCIDLRNEDVTFRDYVEETEMNTVFVVVQYDDEKATVQEKIKKERFSLDKNLFR